MKKLFKTVAVVAAALAVGMLASCSKDADLNIEKVKTWSSTNTNGGKYTITIEADDTKDINWWVLTDMDGCVIPTKDFTLESVKLKDGGKVSKVEDFVANDKASVTYKGKIPAGAIAKLTFTTTSLPASKDAILWVNYNDTEKEEKLGDKTYKIKDLTVRGKVDLSVKTGSHYKASKYPEAVLPVGTLEIYNNEEGGTSSSWSGDYEITEIWPLTKKATKDNSEKYVALSSLKLILKKPIPQKTGVREVIFPIDAKYVAICQPSRFDPANNKNSSSSKYSKAKEEQAQKDQVGWYWCAENPVKTINTTVSKNSSTITGLKFRVAEETVGTRSADMYVPNTVIDSIDVVEPNLK